MEPLWKLPKDSAGLVGFVRKLGYDLQSHLKTKSLIAEVEQSELDRSNGNEGYMLQAIQAGCIVGDIMITPNRVDNREDAFTIDRFQGVRTPKTNYAPETLVEVARTYNGITTFLGSKFGNMIGSRDGRDIYRAFINKTPCLNREKIAR